MPNWPISSSEAAGVLGFGEFAAQFGGAGAREGADKPDHFVAVHADAVVDDGQHPVVGVRHELDVQVTGIDVEVFVLQRCQSAACPARPMRWRSAPQAVLVGVDRMDHQVEQPRRDSA